MELKLNFLGTGCSAPTKERALTGITLSFSGKHALFDCPEGAQKKILETGLSLMKIDYIFFSHFHADHFLGLPGLLATMNMFEKDTPLTIYGPKDVKKMVKKALDIAFVKPCYELKCVELKEGTVLKTRDFEVEAFKLKHGFPCFGFLFKEFDKLGKFNRKKALELGVPVGPMFKKLAEGENVKVKGKTVKASEVLNRKKGRRGRKVAIVLDTLPGGDYLEKIKGADLLVHESVFLESEAKRAKKTYHSTVKQAATAAKKAKVKKLVLTHFSNRYRSEKELEEEAKSVFKNSVISKELMEVEVKQNAPGEWK